MDTSRMTIAQRAAYAIRYNRGKAQKRQAVHDWHDWRDAMQSALGTAPAKPGRLDKGGSEWGSENGNQ